MLKTPRIKKYTLITALIALATLLVINWGHLKSASAAYNVGFSDIWVGTVTPGSGHIGVDMWWPDGTPSGYDPCQHSSDAYYGACVLSNAAQTSYYKVMNYSSSSTDFPYGIFIDNQNTNYCTSASWCTNKTATSFNHGWARLITDASIEIYPHDINGQYNPATNNVGGVRIQTNFPNFANGGRYSSNIGNVALPQVGQPNVGRLNGFVTNHGVTVSNNRALFEAFQEQSSRGTSTGYPMTGFSTVRNNSDGYYNTGALPSGTYKIYITDTVANHKIILTGVNIFTSYERIDFKLDQYCFGYSTANCTDPAP